MMQRVRRVQYTGDPLVLPARSNEIECLVRLFYKLSTRINEAVNAILLLYFRSHFVPLLILKLPIKFSSSLSVSM